MRLPHFFIPAPWARKITGHQGFTYLFWSFVDLPKENIGHPRHTDFRQHEQRHVQQSAAVTVLWLLFGKAVVEFAGLSNWWLLTALAAWPIAYWAVSVVWKMRTGRGYTDNFFERDARRYVERGR